MERIAPVAGPGEPIGPVAGPGEPIGPVAGEDRITLIDCLRGAALFGILTANMRGFNAPLQAYMDPRVMWTWMPDRLMQAAVDCFVQGKFITIFAALFGIGFAIQMDRAAARMQSVGFYRRRMAALLVIGLAHSFLLWWGDILVSYAICGFFLLFFRNRRQRTILVWSQIMYWFVIVLIAGFVIASHFGAVPAPPPPERTLQETIDAYARGTVAEIFRMRASEWLEVNSFAFFLTRVLGIFLLGLYVWRQGYLQQPSAHLDWWRRARTIGLTAGVLGNLLWVAIDWVWHPNPAQPTILSVVVFTVQSAALPALSLGYVSVIVLLWQDPVWQRRLLPFTYVGRMALTNYLMQSLVCTTIFYSYGLGLYGRVGPFADFFLGIVVYSLQIPFSRWWLRRHRYGPMEWVWRTMTYGSLRPATATTSSATQ